MYQESYSFVDVIWCCAPNFHHRFI